MKKRLTIIISFTLILVLLTGCKKNDNNTKNNVNTEGDSINTDISGKNDGKADTEIDKESRIDDNEAKQDDNEEKQGDGEANNTEEIVEKIDINIASLKGPTSMGLVKLMEDSETQESGNNYKFTIAGTADEITAGIINGDYNIAAIPANLAAVLYNKSQGKLAVAGINTLGVLYVVETGEEIQSVEDLKGKTIYSTGKGTTPEYTLNYLLNAYGIDVEKDVTIEYKSEATEVAAILSESDNAVAMLPQPYVTTVMMNNEKVRIALDVAEEWDKISDNKSSVVTGVVVINKEFLENNKEAVDSFLTEYEASAKYVNENIEEASALIEKFNIFKAAVAKKAIPFCNITLITGDDMKTKLNGYLNTLYEQNPNTVGGSMPDDAFFYIK